MEKSAEIHDLSIGFYHHTGLTKVVDQVNFTLKPGETLALLGESGCGKSLTALGMMRLLSNTFVYGVKSEVSLDGQDILELPETVMRTLRGRRLAMIFQEPMTALNPVLDIKQQLREAIHQHQKQLSRTQLHKRMLDLLHEVELPDPEACLHKFPHQLSGGQKQRIGIAMALANDPEVLIADEPTTALDVTIQAQILTLLKKLQQEYQMSLLLITHDMGVVKAMADRVCMMYAGQIIELASVADFFNQPLHPYAQQLLFSLPSFAKRAQHLQTITGCVPAFDVLPSGCRFHPRCAHVFSPCAQIEPALQTISHRSVRCHLYPEHSKPPSLPIVKEDWVSHLSTEPCDIILSVRDLKVYFEISNAFLTRHKSFKAVDGISFDLYKGKTLALVGESGCGKTTVSRAILRLLAMTSGEVLYQGQNVQHLHGYALQHFHKKVQIIFQDPFASMNPRMTIAEILAEGMQGMRASAIRLKQKDLLDQVNLPVRSLQRYPHQFSGGQRQRICIARALATDPELLVCDEPTSALDISVQAQILNLLKSLQQSKGLAYLFITHNMAVVSYIADEVLVMHAGKAVEKGTCEQVLQHPEHPYTKQLLHSVLTV